MKFLQEKKKISILTILSVNDSKPYGSWFWMIVGPHSSSLVTVPVMASGQDMVIFTKSYQFILWHLPCKYLLINAFLPVHSRKYQNLFVFTWQEQH